MAVPAGRGPGPYPGAGVGILDALSGLDQQGDGAVVYELDRHPRAEAAAPRTESLADRLVQRLGLLGRRGADEARALSPARVAVQREVGAAQAPRIRVGRAQVHPA